MDTQILLVPIITPGVSAPCKKSWLETVPETLLTIPIRLQQALEYTRGFSWRKIWRIKPTGGTDSASSWNSVALQVIAIVSQQLKAYPGFSVVTSGHSLGGALSTLAAVALKHNFPEKQVWAYS